MFGNRNPQLNRNGELIHLLSIEGLPRVDPAAHPRHRGHLPERQRPRRQEGAAAARQERVQPVLRELARARARRSRSPPSGSRPTSSTSTSRARARPRARACSTRSPTSRRCTPTCSSCAIRESGAPYLIAQHCAPHVHVVNAGDGRHSHPTQGLLDMYTIRHYKKDFTNLTVAIVGDILHSRVARSDIHALTTLGAARDPRRRPEDAGARRPEGNGRARLPRHGRGHRRRRRDHHAAPAERAHERRDAAERRRVLQDATGSTPKSSRSPSRTRS